MKAMVHVSYLDVVPRDVPDEFASTLRAGGVTVSTEARATGPEASIEWLVPTALTVLVANRYLGTFLEEAAKDHYEVLKRGLGRLVRKTTGSKRDVKLTTVGAGEKVLDANPMILSFYVELRAGRKAKYCFEHSLAEEDVDAAVAALLSSLTQHHDDGGESALAAEEGNMPNGDWKPILLRFAAGSCEWVVWRWEPRTLEQ